MLDRSDEWRLPFDALITGGDAAGGYSWTAVPYSGQTPLDSPRAGVANLFEINGGSVTVGTYQRVWFRAAVGGEPTYEFSAGGGGDTAVAQTIGAASGGLYPATLTEEIADGVWDPGVSVKLRPLDGGPLTIGGRYLARRARWKSGATPVYHADKDCCPVTSGGCACCENWADQDATYPFCVTAPAVWPVGYTGPATAVAVSGTATRALVYVDGAVTCAYSLSGEADVAFPGFGTFTVRVAGVIVCVGGVWQHGFSLTVTDDDEYLSVSNVFYNVPGGRGGIREELSADCDPPCVSLRIADVTAGYSSTPGAGGAPYLASVTVTVGDCALPCDAPPPPSSGGGCEAEQFCVGGVTLAADPFSPDFYTAEGGGFFWGLYTGSPTPNVIVSFGDSHAQYLFDGGFTCGGGGTAVLDNSVGPQEWPPTLPVTPGGC